MNSHLRNLTKSLLGATTFVVMLAACGSITTPTAEIVVQSPQPTPTLEPTFTPSPSLSGTPILSPTATSEPTPTPLPPASLSGRILDQETGQPVFDAKVSADTKTSPTDTDGNYTLTDLTPGQYILSVTHPGYDPGLSKIFTLAGGQDLSLDLTLYAPDTSPYPQDPMLTNPLDPNGAPTKEEAIRLAQEQGLTGEVVSIEETTLTGEYLVNYKIGDDIRAAVAKINHDVWELTDQAGRKWWIIKVCGNLASPLPAQKPIPTPRLISLPPMAEVVVDELIVRACTSEECAKVGAVPRGEQVEVLGCLSDKSWCEVSWSGGVSGWCTGQSLRQLAVAETVLVVEAMLPTRTPGVAGIGVEPTSLPMSRLGIIERVSIASTGMEGNESSEEPSISANGRYVAFTSKASNLVDGDTNNVCDTDFNGVFNDNCPDVFFHDRQTGQTSRISIASNGIQGNEWSNNPSISADGRYVAFRSYASNLVSNDTNDINDIFVHDRQTSQTTRVSIASNGVQGNSWSDLPSISADGRYVAFRSNASNLVSSDTNATADVFVHDRQTGQTTRVSVASNGTQGNGLSWPTRQSISADGRYVAFYSFANNLVNNDTNNTCDNNLDGVYNENCPDVFVHDRQTGQTTRVSIASNGTQGNRESRNPSISADGRYVTFYSWASNLVSGDTNGWPDIFIHNRQMGQTSRVSVASDGTQADNGSDLPSISADGRYVAFYSAASNLINGDTNGQPDVFVYDRQTSQTNCVSIASDNTQSNGWSWGPTISADGRYVAFYSSASNLVSSDTNDIDDVFIHHRGR